MLSTINYKTFDVLLVDFPFSDLAIAKKRPALVLSHIPATKHYGLIILAMISSNIEAKSITGDILIKHWQEAGLLYPSRLRIAKLVTADSTLVLKKLGQLEKADRTTVQKAFRKVFSVLE